jgi:hypothetical protein
MSAKLLHWSTRALSSGVDPFKVELGLREATKVKKMTECQYPIAIIKQRRGKKWYR